jgi:lipoprotein-releasing system ATP-binding protein
VLPGEVPVTLVQDVSLAVERGEFVVIMGPSGSGKSSLLYLLGLLDTPTSGRILLDGQDTSGFGEDQLATTRLRKLGFVFQFHFLLAEFSVLDNVLLPMRRLGALAEDPPGNVPNICSISWVCASTGTSGRTRFPAASASGPPSPARSPTTR